VLECLAIRYFRVYLSKAHPDRLHTLPAAHFPQMFGHPLDTFARRPSKCQLVHSTVILVVTYTKSLCHRPQPYGWTYPSVPSRRRADGRAPRRANTQTHFKLLTLPLWGDEDTALFIELLLSVLGCSVLFFRCLPPNKCLQIFRGIFCSLTPRDANKVGAQTRFMCICKFSLTRPANRSPDLANIQIGKEEKYP